MCCKSYIPDLYHKVIIQEHLRRSPGVHVELSSHTALGTAVRAARNRAAWSQQELADRSGVSRVLVARVERGLGNPTWETVVRLASVLGMRLEATWEGEPASRALQRRRREPRTVVESKVLEKQHAGQKSAPAVGHNAPQVAVSSEPAYVRDAVPEPVDLAELVARTRRP